MRLAIIADVHSNLHALTAAEERLARERSDVVVCAGDIVGYGAHPDECTDIVRRLCSHIVRGNHEEAVLSRDAWAMNPYAQAAARWTWEHISEHTSSLLAKLDVGVRFEVGGQSVAMFHGSVDSIHEYVFEEDATEGLLAWAEADLLILGHTHCPYVRKFASGIVVNPGSIGQPRDGDPRGSYAIYDTEGGCAIRRFDYDIEGEARAIIDAGLPRMLADRLFLGR